MKTITILSVLLFSAQAWGLDVRPSASPNSLTVGTGGITDNGVLVVVGSGTFQGALSAVGNVGIGTTSPATTLDVNGASTLRGAVTVAGATFTINSGVNDGPMFMLRGANTAVRWNDSGDLGGNYGPTQTLFVWDETFNSAGTFHIQKAGQSGSKTSGFMMNAIGDITWGDDGKQSTATATTGSLALAGFLGLGSYTKAALEADTPAKAGQVYYCSDCSNSVRVVVSTAATLSGFAPFVGNDLWH